MFQQLKNLCADFSWDESSKPSGSFYLLKDTLYTGGNFSICQIISTYLKQTDGITLVAADQNYAHYHNSLKRVGQNITPFVIKNQLTYIDLFSASNDWVSECNLPFVEETHTSWQEPPSNAIKLTITDKTERQYYQKIVASIERALETQAGRPAIVIDNLTSLFDRTENKALIFTFVSSLLQLCRTHAKKPSLFMLATCTFDQDLQRLLGIIETYADSVIEFFENQSGYQKDIAGQLILKTRNPNAPVFKFLYSLTENSVEIKHTYTV